MKRNVLITGASRGIGAEAARLFAENGDRVFINYNRSEACALNLRDELKRNGRDVYSVNADVSNSVSVKKMFDEISEICEGIDVLVNNAGIAQTKLFTEITDDEWDKMLAVNLSGAFYCCRAALPYMINIKF